MEAVSASFLVAKGEKTDLLIINQAEAKISPDFDEFRRGPGTEEKEDEEVYLHNITFLSSSILTNKSLALLSYSLRLAKSKINQEAH